ncbi:MAG: hypothetical protein Q8N13_11000 [Acidovorax sp.]|nr:hypothetical protein [Acidovorax sp.]
METAGSTPTPAQQALQDMELDLFGLEPSFTPRPEAPKPTGLQFEFTGTLTRNADVRSKPPRDGLHVVPVVCMELKSILPGGPRYCYVERPFTDATRPAAEALAKSLKKGTTVTVLAPETDLRVSVHHPLSIHPHEAQAA